MAFTLLCVLTPYYHSIKPDAWLRHRPKQSTTAATPIRRPIRSAIAQQRLGRHGRLSGRRSATRTTTALQSGRSACALASASASTAASVAASAAAQFRWQHGAASDGQFGLICAADGERRQRTGVESALAVGRQQTNINIYTQT